MDPMAQCGLLDAQVDGILVDTDATHNRYALACGWIE